MKGLELRGQWQTLRSLSRRGGRDGLQWWPGAALLLAQEDSSSAPPFSPHPGSPGSQCKAQLCGPESAGSCPGLTPKLLHGGGHFLPWGSCFPGEGGVGEPSGKPAGLELPGPASPPTLSPGLWLHPLPTPRGSCPTRGFEDLGLGLPSRRASPPPRQLSQLPPPPKGTSLEGRKEDPPTHTFQKEPGRPLLLPPTLEYIKLCSVAPAPPLQISMATGSIPSPSLNPSPSSAKGGGFRLSPLCSPEAETQHSTGAGGEQGWRPQSSAPSSSAWGAPGGSSGSGVCPPGWG